jgi:hypothetical protein
MSRLTSLCLILGGCLMASLARAAAEPFPGTGDGVTPYEWLQFLHIFLFVFWLGPDVAVYAWSRKAVEANVSAEQRVVAGQMMAAVDIIPRAAMSLMLTVGGLLSEYVGLLHPWWQMAGVILLGPVWLALVLIGFLRDGTPFGATALRLETALRLVLVIAIPLSVAYSTVTGRLAIAPYVGAKLLLFAAVVLLGLLLRSRLAPVRAGFTELATEGPSATLDAAMRAGLARSRPYTVAIWVALLVAALMGVMRLGAPGPDPGPGLPATAVGGGTAPDNALALP